MLNILCKNTRCVASGHAWSKAMGMECSHPCMWAQTSVLIINLLPATRPRHQLAICLAVKSSWCLSSSLFRFADNWHICCIENL
eukprot:jgi/Botrbrau1/8827/Bobra.0335s0015.1